MENFFLGKHTSYPATAVYKRKVPNLTRSNAGVSIWNKKVDKQVSGLFATAGTYRTARGIKITSRNSPPPPPDKVNFGYQCRIEPRIQNRFFICIVRGASFDKNEFKRNLAGSDSYALDTVGW
jgi:hypothetical protein